MSNRPFIVALIAVVILGVGFGGSFAGGFAIGRGQQDAPSTPTSTLTAPQRSQQGDAVPLQQVDPAQLDRFRQAAQNRQGGQSGGRFGAFGGLAGAGGPDGNMFGSIESITEGSITVTTPQGTTTVTIDDSTTLQRVAEIAFSDLEAEANVLVVGTRTDSGEFQASSITVLPEGGGSGVFGAP